MAGLFIGSTTSGTGKSLLSFSLGVMLQNAGYSVGYMKPVGRIHKQVDERLGDADALVVQEVLGQQVTADMLSPVMLPQGLHSLATVSASPDALESIAVSYSTISQGNDVTLVGGTGPFPHTGQSCGADALSIVERLDLSVLLVERFDNEHLYDAVPYIKRLLGKRLAGVVINAVPDHRMYDAEKYLAPYLERRDCSVLGIIPHGPSIAAIRIFDLANALGGRIVASSAKTQRMVEGFIIGAMQVDNFMTYLRRNDLQAAVIVGGDRADLQLAALHASTPCLVLTGNHSPCEMVRTLAESKGVPLICVQEDTYSVAQSMDRILKSKKIGDLGQIRAGVALVEGHLALDRLTNMVISK